MWTAERDVALFADRARERLPVIVADLMDRQHREIPEFFVTDDPAYRDAVQASTHENVELMIVALRRPRELPRALGPGPRLEADVAAQHGAQLPALVRTYRLGQQAMVEHLLEEFDRDGSDGLHRPGAALRQATRTIYDYMEAVIPLVAGEYGAELDRLRARPDLGRLRQVEALLAGDDSVALDYPTTGTHVALVTRVAGAERAVAVAASGLGAASLALRAGDGRCWAWVATRALDELRERLRRAGLSGPAGLGGPSTFRLAHRQARLAARVARASSDLVDLRSVALEALVLGDQGTAREVARDELGPLGGADQRAIRLRDTLEAFFRSRERVGEAARTLGVAPRTVSYRLRRAETLLGHPIAARRAELEAALRIQRLFGDAPPPGP